MSVNEEALQSNLLALQSQIEKLRLEIGAARIAIGVLYATHPDRPALFKAYEHAVEHAMADTLTRQYPDSLVDHFREQLEMLLPS